VFFFFVLYLPYTFLEHKIETSDSDMIIANLSQLNNLSSGQENISRSIRNQIDDLIIPAKDDYKRLDEYYRKLELLESKAILTSSNLSANELEGISPTFLICNQQFHSNITHWVSCNAKFVANGINNKTILRYHELGPQVVPLMRKATYNLQDIENVTSALINFSKTFSRPPVGIERGEWENILKMVSLMKTQANKLTDYTVNVGKLLNKSSESDLWLLLNYEGRDIGYKEYLVDNIDNLIRSLNQSKNQAIEELKDLSAKFEVIEFPVVGKIPLGMVNGVIAYPSAIGIGSLICSYYLGQTISKRLVFHRNYNKLNPNGSFDRELYPVWVDPLDRKLFQYGRLVLFFSLPIVILLLITDLSLVSSTSPVYVVGINFLGISAHTVLAVGVSIGIVLIAFGIFIILKESHEYNCFLMKFKTDQLPKRESSAISKDADQLPRTLSIKRPGYDFIVPIPLVAVIQNGSVTYIKDNYPEKSILPLTTYNPVFEFQFRDGSAVPLVNIRQILIGEIRSYGNISEALESTYIFKNITFNQKTVLPLKHDGFNYMVIEVQFVGNKTGVYAFAFESTPNDSNSPAFVKSLQEQSRQQGLASVDSSPTNIGTNETFLQVSRSVMCHVTLSYGFQVCGEK